MSIAFFEVQPWERESIAKAFPDAVFTEEPLNRETAEKYKESEIVSPFIYSQIREDVLNVLPRLRLIATRSTGYDHIDVAACVKKQVQVANVPEYGSNTVAEHAFALILSLTRRIYQSVNQAKHFNFQHNEIRGVDLAGKTIGIVGLGKIGQHVAKIARGFDMAVVAYNHTQNVEMTSRYQVRYVDFETLLRTADVITFHLPLMPETRHLLHTQNISLCKKGSYLINTARGGLVQTEALVQALETGIFEGVGLDVLEEEKELSEEAAILSPHYRERVDFKTLVFNHILMNHPKVLITPHNAFNSKEALERIIQTTVVNIKAYQEGKPFFVVK